MDLLQRLQSHIYPFAVDVFRLFVWLFLLMAIFVPLERLFAIGPQRVFRKSIFTDLGYYFLNSLLPKMLLVVPMALLAWGLRYVVPERLQFMAEDLPLWGRLAAALVAGEIGFYWGHRWTHEVPFLWRFHAVHHGPEEIDWLVNSHAHPLDIVFVRLCGFVPMYALGLAQPTMGGSVDVVPLLVMLVGTMWGFFIHANVRWRFGFLGRVISTPAFHHWHHTKGDHVNKNYASILPVMDLVFGTWYMPKNQWPGQYGIDGAMAPGLGGQLLQPFVGTEQPPEKAAASNAHTAG